MERDQLRVTADQETVTRFARQLQDAAVETSHKVAQVEIDAKHAKTEMEAAVRAKEMAVAHAAEADRAYTTVHIRLVTRMAIVRNRICFVG